MEIKISRNAPKCLTCLKAFFHEEWVWSQIIETDKEWQRYDFCTACWDQSEKKSALSQWRHRYVDPKQQNKEQEKDDSPLRKLFYEVMEKEHSRLELAIAYLASQLLKREKIFKKIKEITISPKEGHIIIYIDRIDDRMIEVRDPNFTFAEMEEAKNIIIERLDEKKIPENINPQNSITNV